MIYLKEFYIRRKENKLKYFIFKISITILLVGISINLIDFIVNDLIYKTPKPIFKENLDFNILYYVFYEGYLKIGIIGIFIVFLIDFISLKIKKN